MEAMPTPPPIRRSLSELQPLRIERVEDPAQAALFGDLLSRYHYLGCRQHVGEHMKYLVYDCQGEAVSCLLFGSAAWSCADRDRYIGWDRQTRIRHLHLMTNNMRFLIMPWLLSPNLASHILSRIARRIGSDWQCKYRHPVAMLETFVETNRFRGVCYRAANWIYVGRTKGRSRNDRYNRLEVPVKDIYLLPLIDDARKKLLHGI